MKVWLVLGIWLVLSPPMVLVFLNRAPGTYVGTCDSAPITFDVDASGAIGVECASIHAVLITTEGITVQCEVVPE